MDILNDFQDNYGNGWIKLYRSIKKHWIWQDPIKLKWWLDIILSVNHSGKKINIGYEIYDCNPGQSIKSLKNWADSWNVSKDTVRNFFTLLKKDNMILTENLKKTTRITICNYDIYQSDLHVKQTQSKRKANAKQTQGDPNKNDKNVNNDNKIDFDVFWNLYDYKKDRKKSVSKWNNLSIEIQQKIIDYIPGYIASTSDKKFRKHPSTFLNNESWENELTESKTIEQRYVDYYKANKTAEGINKLTAILKHKKDVLYKLNDIITLNDIKDIKLNGNIDVIIISFQDYGTTKDEFVTNFKIHARKY